MAEMNGTEKKFGKIYRSSCDSCLYERRKKKDRKKKCSLFKLTLTNKHCFKG